MTDPTPTNPKLAKQPCGWCNGEGALRDADGKLAADCPRCVGASVLGDGLVATITLAVRKGDDGRPVWIADDKHEARSAEAALATVGRTMDVLLAQVPGFRWGEL